jgi:hypothetical protein
VFSNNSNREAQGKQGATVHSLDCGGVGNVKGLSAERRMQFVARGAMDCHVYGQVCGEALRDYLATVATALDQLVAGRPPMGHAQNGVGCCA